MSKRKEHPPQLSFESAMRPSVDIDRVQIPDSGLEREYKAVNHITFSQVEKIIYRNIAGVEPRNVFDESARVGSAIDDFLTLANFIYRYRASYCLSRNKPDWDLENVFANFYPTGYDYTKLLNTLQLLRPTFQKSKTGNISQMTKAGVCDHLDSVLKTAVKKFQIDTYAHHSIMNQVGDNLQPTENTAIAEGLDDINKRIIEDRFEQLVSDDDPDFTYVAKPDFLLVLDVDGQVFHLQVQPDYIKRKRNRKSTKAKDIIVQRIAGDYKDTDRKDLGDLTTPYGVSMAVYDELNYTAAQKTSLDKPQQVRTMDGRKRRVFLIPQDAPDKFKQHQIQTELEYLREDPQNMSCPMPLLDEDRIKIAREVLLEALRISKRIKIY